MTDQLQVGVEVDTGKKYINPSTGEASIIYKKVIDTGSLPNNTNEDTAHGIIGLSLAKPVVLKRITGFNGTTTRLLDAVTTITVTATNVNIATTANLSAYTSSLVEIEYSK